MPPGQKSVRLKLNSPEVQRYLDGDHGVRGLLMERAARVLQAAKDDPHDDTYAYENSLHIEEDHTDRLAVRVKADDYKAGILEARYGILARAMDSAR